MPRLLHYITAGTLLILLYLILQNPHAFRTQPHQYQYHPPSPPPPTDHFPPQPQKTLISQTPLAALRFLANLYLPQNDTVKNYTPKPVEAHKVTDRPDPFEAFRLARGAQSWGREEILECVRGLPKPHLLVVGDSVSRD
ncbi:hypothetical protein HDV00_009011, partial [Rhizophlyctis rosea]